MTVLDVLRYPISSIYNIEEINALPAELFAEWVEKEITGISRNDLISSINDGFSRWTYVHAIVDRYSQSLAGGRRHYGNRAILELTEIALIASLKKTIAEYEPL